MDYENMKFEVITKCEGIPAILEQASKLLFVRYYNKAVGVFNDNIDGVNRMYDSAKSMAIDGHEHESGMNDPSYIKWVKSCMNLYFNTSINNGKLVKYRIGDDGCIEGYLPKFPDSRISLEMKVVE